MIHVPDVDTHWEWVRKGLDAVIKKTDADWSPADVYLMLKNKQAFLYTLGQEDGFCVLQKQVDVRGPYLFVWVIWGRLWDIQDQVMKDIRDIAVAIGARKIQMKSPRTAWERLGWEVKEIIYEVDIWPGDKHG